MSSGKSYITDLCVGPKLKEGWLEKREKKGFVSYYVILKSNHVFFFNSEKTDDSKRYLGFIELTPDTECLPRQPKKGKHKWEFELRIDIRRIFLFRLKTEKELSDWIAAIYTALNKEPKGVTLREEAAGFLTFKDLPGTKSYGVLHRKIPQRRETIPGQSADVRHTTTIQKKFSFDRSNIPQAVCPQTDAIAYDPVVLYFRWYYPKMTREESEEVLTEQPVGTYLLRDSESARYRDFYTLSFRDKDRIKHHKIEPRQSGNQLTYVFHGDERMDFKNPGDAVVFLMSSKQAFYPTKPYIMERPQNLLKPVLLDRERTSGDGMEGKLATEEEADDYLQPLTNNEYLRRRQQQVHSGITDKLTTKGKRSKSASELPSIPFPDLPTQEQLEEGLFGDYQNFDAVKVNSLRFGQMRLHDEEGVTSAFYSPTRTHFKDRPT